MLTGSRTRPRPVAEDIPGAAREGLAEQGSRYEPHIQKNHAGEENDRRDDSRRAAYAGRDLRSGAYAFSSEPPRPRHALIWPGAGGIIVTVIYILLGNLPFIIIQRYNRPRLQRLYAMQQRKRERSSI